MPNNELSSTTFANEPIVNLLRKPVHQMSPDELRAYATELRNLRTQPQGLGRKLRKEAVEDEEVEERREVKRVEKAKSVDDLLKELGG